MNDRNIIKAFVTYLREHGHSGLEIDSWPDEENRNSPDIDAIAGNFAIEHTSIDTLPNQRRDSDWLMQVVGGIEQEIPTKLSFRLRITLKYDAVVKGQDWPSVRNALKNWIIEEAPSLNDGHHVLRGIDGIPFQLVVKKASKRPPGIFFARFQPADETLPDRIKKLFDRKGKKLAKYHVLGMTSMLLVENDNIALMNEDILLAAIREAFPNGLPEIVAEVWYADTSNGSAPTFMDFTPYSRKESFQ